LGIVDRILDGLELLSELEAGPPPFDQADDRLKMPFRAPEAADDLGMVLVLHGPLPVLDRLLISPRQDSRGRYQALECGGVDTALCRNYILGAGYR
jgi:hypothetical protein